MPYLIGKDWSLSISEDGNTMIDVGRVSGLQLSRSYGSNEITTTSNDGEKNYELSDESRTISLSCVRDDEDDGQEILLSYAEGRSPLFYDLRSSSTGERYVGRFIVSDYSITVSSSEASQVEFSLRCIFFDLGDPILDVDFAGTESLIDQSSQRNLITFSRSTVATYVGFDGLIKTASVGEPRIERDPISREPQGILIEKQSTNHIGHSELLEAAGGWSGTSVLDGSVINPAGVYSSYRPDPPELTRALGYTGGSTVSFSFFIRPVDGVPRTQFVEIFTRTTSPPISYGYTINLDGGNSDNTWFRNINLEPYPNNWIRVTGTLNSTTVFEVSSRFDFDQSVTSHNIWGVQFEEGGISTSYIKTQGGAVTRSRDDARIEGANLRSVLQLGNNSADAGSLAARNLKEATIVCSLKKIDRSFNQAAQIMFAMSDNGGGVSGNRLDIRIQNKAIRIVFILADYGETVIADHQISDREDAVIAVAFDASGFTSVVNDGPFVDQVFTSWPLPLFNILQIGNGDGLFDLLAIPLRSVKVYDRRMTKAEMRHLCGVG